MIERATPERLTLVISDLSGEMIPQRRLLSAARPINRIAILCDFDARSYMHDQNANHFK